MKRYPECRPRLWDGLIAAAVLALAVFTAGITWGGGDSQALTVVVSANGQEVERFPLKDADERIYTAEGYTLRVTASEAGVCVAESNCPTQDCVHSGVISRSGQSIVCLPARMTIRLVGSDSGVDAVIG